MSHVMRAALMAGGICLAGQAAATDRALIVGIDSYPDIRMHGAPHARDLKGATNDALRMKDLVTTVFGVPEKNVTLLLDEEASGRAIIDAFQNDLVNKTKPGDHVYFYYAGHGAQVVDDNGDETDDHLDEVLVPSDAVAELGEADATLNGVIYDDDIGTLVSELDGRIVTVIVDACHSGTITRGYATGGATTAAYSPIRTITPNGPRGHKKLNSAKRDILTELKGEQLIDPVKTRGVGAPELAVWSAVSAGQYALEDMSQGGSAGLFTSRFIRGLAGMEADLNHNGAVTPAELLAYLRKQTKAYCGSYDCLGQDPLPRLEAFDDYQRYALAVGDGSGTPVAFNDAVPQSDAIIRETGVAVPTDMLPASDKPVSVTLKGGAQQKLGSALNLTVTAPEAGRLIVLDRRESGETVQLFPNSYSRMLGQSDLVKAGETVAIPGDGAPFELTADTAGKGTITALVVDPSVDVKALIDANQDLADIADATGYANTLAGAVSRAVTFTVAANDPREISVKAPLLLRGDAPYDIEK
ncbi:caspase family protein [Oryzibacter oryziterrae]|uniref:caspase family protein n=1 Tax=Oryzibacter oryziterrae TaxID=2766474 RepID=UPI001F2BEB33|nr:caspase family protein [Oryzibacter oryziterrae]